jgi:hypothetical protein
MTLYVLIENLLYMHNVIKLIFTNFSLYNVPKPRTWVKVGSNIIGWYMPSLGVLVGDTLLPVRQIPVVPVQISTVKLGATVPHVVKGMYTVVWRVHVGNIIQGASYSTATALLGVM